MSELDSFDEIESSGALRNDLILSNVYSVRQGGFGLDMPIKTFITTLTVSELESDVSFYDTLSNEKDWPVSQIVQREVDKIRVNSITKKYLLGKGRYIKYFPPIIIALLPRNEEGDFQKEYVYTPDQDDYTKELIFDKSKYRANPKFKDVLMKVDNSSLVAGLYLYEDSKVFEHNLLCWDKSKFYAVVIDGQHRLDALLKSKSEDAKYSNVIQDVVFIDVSGLVKVKQGVTPVEVLRTIFIDINTNAKSVSLVRRVLIDDKDLNSLCVQSLVDSVKSDGTAKTVDEFIPSVIIDWHGESLKHELPHITGILTLFQILSDELITNRLITIDDHRDQHKIKKFIDLLNSYFFVDTIIKNNPLEYGDIVPLDKSLNLFFEEKKITREIFSEELQEEDLIDSILFNYDYRTLEIAQKTFENLYLKSIKKILTDFHPYAQVIKVIQEKDGFNSKTNLYKALLSSKSKMVKNTVYKDLYLNLRSELQEALHTNYYLFFLVVGQKALFKVFFEEMFRNFAYGITEGSILKLQGEYIDRINKVMHILDKGGFLLFGKEEIDLSDRIPKSQKTLLEFGTIATSFWEGIILEDKRVIYNSQGVRAFADVIYLIMDCIEHIEQKSKPNLADYTIRFSQQRTKRVLKKRFDNRADDDFDKFAKQIINLKKNFIYQKLKEICES